jgi:hypothetical protein
LTAWPYRDFVLELGASRRLWLQTSTDHRPLADGTAIALARVSGARRERVPARWRGAFDVAVRGRPLRRAGTTVARPLIARSRGDTPDHDAPIDHAHRPQPSARSAFISVPRWESSGLHTVGPRGRASRLRGCGVSWRQTHRRKPADAAPASGPARRASFRRGQMCPSHGTSFPPSRASDNWGKSSIAIEKSPQRCVGASHDGLEGWPFGRGENVRKKLWADGRRGPRSVVKRRHGLASVPRSRGHGAAGGSRPSPIRGHTAPG